MKPTLTQWLDNKIAGLDERIELAKEQGVLSSICELQARQISFLETRLALVRDEFTVTQH